MAQSSRSTVQQDSIGALPVRERPRPDYDPLGIIAGPYLVFPSLTVGADYDSNIFADEFVETDDFFFLIQPAIIAESQFSRHALDIEARLSQLFFEENTSEDRTNGRVNVKGRLDIASDLVLAGRASVAFLSEPRTSPDSPGAAAEPISFEQYSGNLVLRKRFNRVSARLGGEITGLNFDDVASLGGGIIDQDFRDGVIYKVNNRWAYRISQDYAVFALGEFNQRVFEDNRDSIGGRVLGGVEFALSPLVTGEVGAGFLQQEFEDDEFSDVSTGIYSAALEWLPTPLISIKLEGERFLSESSLTRTSTRLDSTLELIVDYEFRRNLLVTPSFSYVFQDFQDITREDEIFSAGLKADYLVNRNLQLGFEYTFIDRRSSDPGEDFSKHIVGINVRAQF